MTRVSRELRRGAYIDIATHLSWLSTNILRWLSKQRLISPWKGETVCWTGASVTCWGSSSSKGFVPTASSSNGLVLATATGCLDALSCSKDDPVNLWHKIKKIKIQSQESEYFMTFINYLLDNKSSNWVAFAERRAEVSRRFPQLVWSWSGSIRSCKSIGETNIEPTKKYCCRDSRANLVPRQMTEFNGNSFGHFPILGENSTHSVFEIQEVAFDPSVPPVDAIQPAVLFRLLEQMTVLDQLESYEPSNYFLPASQPPNINKSPMMVLWRVTWIWGLWRRERNTLR